MSRKSKKKLTNRAKLLITVAIIAICLFVMHRFNILTKSEMTITTSVNFKEYGTENSKKADIEVFEDEAGEKYIILPETVNGFYAQKYFVELKEVADKNDNTNAVTNEITNTIEQNEVVENNIDKTSENKVDDSINNTISNESTNSNNTISNESTNSNNIISNKVENVSNSNTIQNIIKENTNTVETSAIASVNEDVDSALENNSTVENSNTVIANNTKNVEEDKNTNTISENTVDLNNNTENTNTVENVVESNISTTEEQTTNKTEEQPENNTQEEVQETTQIQENLETELPSGNPIEINMDENVKEYLPGEKIYITEEEFENSSVEMEVVYNVLEMNGLKLYKQLLKSDLDNSIINVSGFIPDGYYLSVESLDVNQMTTLTEDVKEFEGADVLLLYDIKIVNGTAEYQPKEYNQIVNVSVESNTALEGKLIGRPIGIVHIKETETEIVFEKIDIATKTTNSVDFITNEFSEYAIMAYAIIQDDAVTIDDYESDKNYYTGKNYTDEMVGTDQGNYKDLATVEINYYGYDPTDNFSEIETVTLTNANQAFTTTEANSNGYRNYTGTLTITSTGKDYIDVNSGWTMKFDVPDANFNAARTQTLNGNKFASISSDDTTVTITGNNFYDWTQNNANSLSLQFIIALANNTNITISSLNNFEFSFTKYKPIAYISAEEDNADTAEVNESERQNLVRYIKAVPVDKDNNIVLELIDNPFMDRPYGFGFNGWTTNEANYNFSINNDTKLQKVTVNVGTSRNVVINLRADWQNANVVFVDTENGNDNNAGNFNNPVSSWTGINSRLSGNRKTATNASDRELNIVVLKNGTLNGLSNDSNTSYTLTSLYNGVDYRANAELSAATFTAARDLQLDYLNIINSGYYTSTTTTGNITPYLIGGAYNIRIGRGMMPLNVGNNTTSFAQIQGRPTSGNTSRSYRLVIESGRYANIQTGGTQGYTYTSSATLVLGNDYDRVLQDNTQLEVYNRVATRSGAGTITSKDAGEPVFKTIVKSGTIGIDYFEYDDDEDYAFAGIYLGGHSSGTDNDDRVMIVEGGDVANILGGLAIQSDTSTVKTYIYMKGGNVQNIVGGAGVSTTRGDRIIQVTDGFVNYSISGGSNGFSAGQSNSSNPTGRLNGDTLIYIGGGATIGQAYIDNTSTAVPTLYYVEAGCVLGAGNGNDDPEYADRAGSVYSSHIIVDGNAKIANNVYGGGNYGRINFEQNTTTTPDEDQVEVVEYENISNPFNTTTQYMFASGMTSGYYLRANGTGIGRTAFDEYTVPSSPDDWMFENAANSASLYYVKNVSTGLYINIEYVYRYENVNLGDWWNSNYQNVITGISGVNVTLSDTPTPFSISYTGNGANAGIRISDTHTYTRYVSSGGWFGSYSPQGTTVTYYLSAQDASFSTTQNTIYLLKYTPLEIEDDDTEVEDDIDVVPGVTIDIFGGTVGNNVYGGPNNNDVRGSVKINMTGGTVNGTIYGGSNTSGTVTGLTLIKIDGGTIGTLNQTATTEADAVFGGGKGTQTEVSGNTYVDIYDNKNNVILYGSVYGGSEAGDVGGASRVRVKDAFSDSYTISTNSNIYGGGRGLTNDPATTDGDVTVIVDGGTYPTLDVFGGCNVNGEIGGSISVEIGEKNATSAEYVFGAGNQSEVTTNTNSVQVDIYKNANVKNAFNGGNNAGIAGNNTQLPRKITVDGGTVGNLYGGSNADGDLVETFVYTKNQANIGNVYGGGLGANTLISGNTYVDIQDSTITPNVFANATEAGGNVYGGGSEGPVNGNSVVNVQNSTIEDSLYGGGKSANVSATDIDIASSTIIKNIYGGGENGAITGNINGRSTDVNIENSQAGNIFGGGKGETATIANNTMLTIIGTKVVGDKEAEDATETAEYGNVYGGGDKGAVSGSTVITISDSSAITNNVFGGGNQANVAGDTSIYLENSSSGSVYGGGNAGVVNGTGNVDNAATVTILGSTIDKNVYGGGNKGQVVGNSYVLISDSVDDDGNSLATTTVGGSVYGGGRAANVNGTYVGIQNKTQAQNIFGGGELGEVETSTNVYIEESTITNSIYGGGKGTDASSDSSMPGQVKEDCNLEILNNTTINNRVFGGGQGVTAVVGGNTIVDFKGNSSTGDDIYGGGDNGPVNGTTKLFISSGNVGGSAYAAGNGATALVSVQSYLGIEGNSVIAKSVFGGGNAAETGEKYMNADKETGDALVIVDISGATIGENVYGGANSSVIYGSTVTNIGVEAINDYYTKLQEDADANGEEPVAIKPLENFIIGKIEIGGTIFGGGEQMDPTKEFNYDTISVTETILINIDGEGYETSDTDTNTFNFYESVFGSGNASSANTNGNINIRNYGTREKPKRGISIQRATDVIIDNVSILLNGTTDSTSAHPEGLFALNRINHLKIKNDTTLYLVNGANLLAHYSSMVGEDGQEEYADVKIVDTVVGENGDSYEVINGKIYDDDGDLQYYVSNGIVYEPNNTGIGEDTEVTKVATVENATTIEKNTDNRIYMYSGRNLNISDDEEVTSKYGDVKGMTFFGIFKSDGGDTDGEDSTNSVYMGMYDPNYSVGSDVEWNERNFNRSYVLGLHERNPEQDIAKDGFYTVYEKLGVELGESDILTEENYSTYNPTSYTSYITPTPKDDVYYMWYAGPDDEVFYYNFTLTASKHSTFGTKELSLLGISYENAVLTVSSVDASLVNGVGLYDKNTIPNINTDQDAANNNFGLTMKTSTSGWSMTGSTDFYADAITEDNNTNNTSYSGTNKYIIENLKTTPAFVFFLYHSNNITEARELGTVQVNMNLSYWKDALNRGNARVIIDAVLLSEVYDDTGYNGAIAPGSHYDLFANTVTNITTKSSFSTYFEFAQDNFSEIENVKNYYDDSYRVITTEYAFPTGTTITMIDRWDKNNPSYYYYDVTASDYAAGKVEYKLSEFKVMGSSNEMFDEKAARENYHITENGMDYEYENFIFISNFENAQFPDLPDGETAITHDQHFRMYLKTMIDGREEILFGLLDDQIDSIVYGIYDTESTIDINAEVSKSRVFLGNEVFLNVNTIYDVKKGEQSVTIYDTRYFDKKLGVKLTFYKKNDDTGVYEIVNGANLLGTYFELNGEKYYPRADGTTRIKIADLVSNASSSIKIGTENSALATGEYQIKVESFGSADGIYYGVEASATAWVSLELINDVYGLNSTLPEEQVIIDKTTGYTLDATTGKMNEAGHNELNFSVEYLSGLNNPYITVSLLRREYDETMNNPYQNTYTLVDLSEYVSDTLEIPVEINQEYTEEDQEFVDSIKQFEYEYVALDTDTIKASVVDNTVSVTLSSNYTLKENLKSGTYKVVFKLYDVSDTTVYKEETDENGEVISKTPFEIKDYMYIGDTFSYIIIK
ncbi:MAG: hypothetical protein IJW20_04290 [Clostridia bacterium]|nr:hypothetical protein [Clostridia bacterium]